MKQLISKIIYKTTIITLVLGFFIQTISLFPFYVFASTSSNFEEININSVNNVDEENVRLLYEIEDLRSDFLKVFRRTDGKLEYAYYNDLVNYFDGEKYLEVDASYKLDNNEYSQEINKYSVKLPKKLHESKKIKLSFDNSEALEITYNDISKVEGVVIDNETDTSKINELKNISGSVLYSNIFDDVDLKIESTGTKFKENIILNEYVDNFSFSYNIKLKGLTLTYNDEIIEFINEEDEIIYEISPYFMYDANNNYSEDIDLKVEQLKEDEYKFTVTPNENYLKTAEYPVTVDPIVRYKQNSETVEQIKIKTIDRSNNTATISDSITVTKNTDGTSNLGVYSLIEIPALSINLNIKIDYARLTLQGASNSYLDNAVFGKTSITKNLDLINASFSYTTSNKNDFLNVGNGLYTVDFTSYVWENRIKKKIYEISPEKFTNNGQTQIYSFDTQHIPILSFYGYEDSGLQPNKTYEELPAGNAGCAYVAHSTGEMVLEKTDYINSAGTIALKHYYNSNKTTINNGYGKGFSLNFNESITELTQDSNTYLKYTNGTTYNEYFYYDSNLGTYHSEDGNSYKIIKNYANNGTLLDYTLRSDDYDKIFNSNGKLIKIVSNTSSGNANAYKEITITYTASGLLSVIELDDIKLELVYENEILQQVNVYKLVENITNETVSLIEEVVKKIVYEYNSDNYLTGIITKNVTSNGEFITDRVYYGYDENNLLCNMYHTDTDSDFTTDTEVYEGIYLEYTNKKVVKYGMKTLLQDNSTEVDLFDIINIEYLGNTTKYTDYTGYYKLYSFDYFKHTISIIDSLGMATYYEYENFANELSNANPVYIYKNKVKYISDPICVLSSPIKNGSFEELTGTDDVKYWETNSANAVTPSGLIQGTKVLEIKKDIYSSNALYASQVVNLTKGTYTISAFGYMNYNSNTNQSAVKGKISVLDEEGNLITSNTCLFDSEQIENKTLSFTLNESKNVTIKLSLESIDVNYSVNIGDAFYVDNLAINSKSLFATSNLIQEPSFESLNSWVGTSISLDNRSNYNDLFGDKQLNIKPNQEITQEIFYSSKSGDKFNLGGFVEYYNLTGEVSISVRFYNSTSSISSDTYNLSFGSLLSSLQYATSNVVIDEDLDVNNTYDRIEIKIRNDSMYSAYVDNVFLFPTFIGTEYEYNSNGKVKEIEEENEKYILEYNSDNTIKKITTLNYIVDISKETNETYDLRKQVTSKISATTNNIAVTSFDYFNYENNTMHSFTGNVDEDSDYIIEGIFTSNTYDKYNNYILESIDEFNYKTVYEYDYKTDALVKVKKYVDNTSYNSYIEHNYSYNNLGQLETSSESYNGSLHSRLEYQYDDFGRISSILLNGEESRKYSFTYDNLGNLLTVKLNNTLLKSYEYYYYNGINTGLVSKETYTNGEYKRYEYNERLELVGGYSGFINESDSFEEVLCYNITYTEVGNINSYHDYLDNTVYLYNYDGSGNLTRINIQGVDETSFIEFTYNDKNELISQKININGIEETTSYVRSDDNVITSTTINNSIFDNPVDYTDSLKRICDRYISYRDVENDDVTTILTEHIEYASSLNNPEVNTYDEENNRIKDIAIDANLTSLLPNKQTLTFNNCTYTIFYEYDAFKNITKITIDSPSGYDDYVYNYTYALNSTLTGEEVYINNVLQLDATYTYDLYGNLTSISRTTKVGKYASFPSTQTYSYNTQNQLTSYTKDNVTYTVNYDINGNMLTYLGGTFSYVNNQLSTYTKDNTTVSYEYNANGIRTRKIVNGITYEYVIIGNKILQQNVYSTNNVLEHSLRFMYDKNDNVLGFELILPDGTIVETIYYVKNIQNDVIKLVNHTGEIVGEYIYDAYGNIVNINELSIFAYENPFRYKSYYHDQETNLYYCNSRYYNPEICRWTTMDEVEYLDKTLVLGCNLYTYCVNNPVVNKDNNGTTHLNTGKSFPSVYIIEDTNGVYRHRVSNNQSFNNILIKVKMDGKYNFKFQENPDYDFITAYYYAIYIKQNYYMDETSRTALGLYIELQVHYGLYLIGNAHGVDGCYMGPAEWSEDKSAYLIELYVSYLKFRVEYIEKKIFLGGK